MPKGVYLRTPENTRKPRVYPPHIVELACSMYEDGMTVAEIRAVFPKGYRVQTILERHLPERRPQAKRDQRGVANHMWRGDDAGYQATHLRLGAAAEHSCVDCGGNAQEWSYEGGCPDEKRGKSGSPYCTHADHYQPRCTKCHRAYDFKGHRPNGQWLSREEVMPHV